MERKIVERRTILKGGHSAAKAEMSGFWGRADYDS